jgi:quinol monooxygenase YgiN
MSIAQVLNLSGGPGAGSAVPEEADEMVEVTKALDGCEHIYSMANSLTGDGMAIIVWRDEAAMKAAGDHIAADNEALKGMLSITLSLGPVYDNFMEM